MFFGCIYTSMVAESRFLDLYISMAFKGLIACVSINFREYLLIKALHLTNYMCMNTKK